MSEKLVKRIELNYKHSPILVKFIEDDEIRNTNYIKKFSLHTGAFANVITLAWVRVLAWNIPHYSHDFPISFRKNVK